MSSNPCLGHSSKHEDPKPSAPKAPFSFYVQSCRQDFEANHSIESINYVKFMTKCVDNWKAMTDIQKAPFLQLAQEDNIRNGRTAPVENDEAAARSDSPRSKRAKIGNRLHPDYPLSPFYWYCCDHRPRVVEEFPSYDPGEVAIVLGQRWVSSSLATKQKYTDMARDKTNV